MSEDQGAPPQVIRRSDGSFHVLNVDFDSLTNVQRLAIAAQVFPQIKSMLEAAGEYREREQGLSAPLGIGVVDDIYRAAAEATHTAITSVARMTPAVLHRPDVVERMLSGEIASMNDVLRAVGRNPGIRLDEGADTTSKRTSSFYGHGDKFAEATEPLVRYLKAWDKKDFRYTHVNPREAQRRLARIEEISEWLGKAKEDLTARSHVASYAVSSERRERK